MIQIFHQYYNHATKSLCTKGKYVHSLHKCFRIYGVQGSYCQKTPTKIISTAFSINVLLGVHNHAPLVYVEPIAKLETADKKEPA